MAGCGDSESENEGQNQEPPVEINDPEEDPVEEEEELEPISIYREIL